MLTRMTNLPEDASKQEYRLKLLHTALTNSDLLQSHLATEELETLPCSDSDAMLICSYLQSDSPETRARAAHLCSRLSLNAKELVPSLLSAIQDRLWSTRESAALALAPFVPDDNVQEALLERVLLDKNELVRMAALSALSETLDRQRQVLDALHNALKDSRHIVRTRAARALANFHGLACFYLDSLAETLKDSHWRVRLAAADTLKSLGPAAKRTLPALIRRRYDGDRRVRIAALEAIREIYPGTPRPLHRIFQSLLDRFYDGRQILQNSFKAYDFPREVELQFSNICVQRIDLLTNNRRELVIKSPQETNGWETACAVVKATSLAGLKCNENKEFTKLLAHLVEIWLGNKNLESLS